MPDTPAKTGKTRGRTKGKKFKVPPLCRVGLFLLMLRHDPAPLNPCTRGMQISERARTPVLPRSSDVLKAQCHFT
ncbi:conserved hypothetical protein [Treponema phagedenis]|uniref:Uncharacterized protein n=1 Tax=Treponema phagedenis TaxID=162 RepID=A0A0B7GX87_TREPH|nr:conserved hypothetical protein [Treponema phagedenis]